MNRFSMRIAFGIVTALSCSSSAMSEPKYKAFDVSGCRGHGSGGLWGCEKVQPDVLFTEEQIKALRTAPKPSTEQLMNAEKTIK